MDITNPFSRLLDASDFDNPEALKARRPHHWEMATQGTRAGNDYSENFPEKHVEMIERSKESLRELDEEINQRQEHLRMLRQEGEFYNHDAAERYRELQDRYEQIKDEVKAERQLLPDLRDKRRQLEERISELQADARMGSRVESLLEDEAEDLEEEIQGLKAQKEKLDEEIAEAEAFVDRGEEILQQAYDRMKEAQNEALSVAESMAAEIVEQQVELLRRLNETQNRLERLGKEASLTDVPLGHVGFKDATEGIIEFHESYVSNHKGQ